LKTRFNAKRKVLILLAISLVGCSSYKPVKFLEPAASRQAKGALHARFLGTSTILLTDGNNSILFDGFFTRQGVVKHIAKGLKPNQRLIDKAIAANELGDINALFVSHSHYDHALDAGVVAAKTKATLMGSSKTLGFSPTYAKKQLIPPNASTTIGKFKITAFETPHVPKNKVSLWFEKMLTRLMRGSKYIDSAEVFSFYIDHPSAKVLIIPSAGFERDNIPENLKADVVFLGIGLLSKQGNRQANQESPDYIERYWQAAVENTGAKLVIPIHFDDFRKPYGEKIPVTLKYIDDISYTMDRLNDLVNRHKGQVTIAFPPKTKMFDLSSVY
jgi:L-ascorbate metabolism protein UlaG (beta-lactamase superfamily)